MNAAYLITRSACYFPERVAFVFDGRPISFRDLNRRINKLVNGLTSLGLKKGDRVGLLFHNSLPFLESYLALYKAGLLWVRLNARLSISEMKIMLEDSEAAALIGGPEFEEVIKNISSGLRNIIQVGKGPGLEYGTFLQKGSEEEPNSFVNINDLSDIWYTSGTSGTPKGIMLTHRNILTCTQLLLCDTYEITVNDKLLTVAPLSHAGSVRILPFVVRGATNYLHNHFDPLAIFKEIENSRITDISLTPTTIIALMNHPRRANFDLSSLKRITYGGSPMPVERIKEAVNVFGPILDQSYGQAESIITITHLPRNEHCINGDPVKEKRLASAGREYSGVQVRIINEDEKFLSAGEIGEIVTKSDLVMEGYWKKPPETKEALKGGWLHTGDIGYLDNEGYLFLVDRKNDKIITGGLNVFPREVEEILACHPGILEVSVFGVKDPYWVETIEAAVVLRPNMNVTAEDIIQFCEGRLAGYKKPKKIHFMNELPKNLYNKVLRKDLKAHFEKLKQ